MTFATIITARSSSKRLKNKILLDISKNYKCVDILIERSKLVGLPIILATSIAKSDDKLVRYVKNNHKIIIFRGSLNNKVKRWYNCFTKYNLTSACFIDGDDLLFDYHLYKKNFIKAKKISRPYMLKNPKNIVTGAFTYIINFKFLEKIYKKSQKVKDVDVIEGFCKNINNELPSENFCPCADLIAIICFIIFLKSSSSSMLTSISLNSFNLVLISDSS